jgi:hypothetical protein
VRLDVWGLKRGWVSQVFFSNQLHISTSLQRLHFPSHPEDPVRYRKRNIRLFQFHYHKNLLFASALHQLMSHFPKLNTDEACSETSYSSPAWGSRSRSMRN